MALAGWSEGAGQAGAAQQSAQQAHIITASSDATMSLLRFDVHARRSACMLTHAVSLRTPPDITLRRHCPVQLSFLHAFVQLFVVTLTIHTHVHIKMLLQGVGSELPASQQWVHS